MMERPPNIKEAATRRGGPVLAPLSGGKAAALVVLLHGVAAKGDDLLYLARAWQEVLPEAEFIAPDAPFPVIMRRSSGNGSACKTERRTDCSRACARRRPFSKA